jgi:hypothetical protein
MTNEELYLSLLDESMSHIIIQGYIDINAAALGAEFIFFWMSCLPKV